jgi:hypothetical protein
MMCRDVGRLLEIAAELEAQASAQERPNQP